MATNDDAAAAAGHRSSRRTSTIAALIMGLGVGFTSGWALGRNASGGSESSFAIAKDATVSQQAAAWTTDESSMTSSDATASTEGIRLPTTEVPKEASPSLRPAGIPPATQKNTETESQTATAGPTVIPATQDSDATEEQVETQAPVSNSTGEIARVPALPEAMGEEPTEVPADLQTSSESSLLANKTPNVNADKPSLRSKAASQTADSPLIMAYYYPWCIHGDWSQHGYTGTPELGLYGTDEPAIAEQHIEWAAGAIDTFVVSWGGPDSIMSEHLATGLLQAKNLDQINFCIHYESLGRLDEVDGELDDRIDFSVPAVMETFIADFQHLKTTYFGHDQYMKLKDGRPVVPIYVTRTFKDFKHAHIEQLEDALGMKLFLIADEAFFWEESDPHTALNGIDSYTGGFVFEAYTAYDMFEDENVQEGESTWSYMQREALPIFERWSRVTSFVPQVMPSYHDFRGHKPLTGGKEGFLAQLKTMQCLPKPGTDKDVPDLLFITTFNEWFEGTTMEPAAEYGTMYLDSLREYRSSRQTCDQLGK